MAGSVNKVILVGNLGKDPEIRRTQDGRPIANLSVATSESWRDKATGERKEKTEWHRVVIFNEGLCRIAEQYLKKGAKVYLEGQLQTRKWTDNAGIEKYSTEVVLQGFNSSLTMLDSRGSGGGGDFASDEWDRISARPVLCRPPAGSRGRRRRWQARRYGRRDSVLAGQHRAHAVDDELHGQCRQDNAEQTRQDDIAGDPEQTIDAVGEQEDRQASRHHGSDDAEQDRQQ